MIVALIPARAGSERIPNKNIKRLEGQPLIAWTIATALACPSIDKVLVSSDNTVIREIAEQYGAEGLSRPNSLSGPTVTDWPVIKHCLQVLPGIRLVVYLRPTTPLRSTELVEKAIKMVQEGMSSVTGLRSVHKMPESAFKCFTVRNGLLRPVTREGFDLTDHPEQEVEPTYKPNGYVDIALPATVLAPGPGTAWGSTVIPYVTPPVIELDEPQDWDYLTYLLKTRGEGESHEFYREGGLLKTSWGI